MAAFPDIVAGKLAHLPDAPGVYLWKDAAGLVLYVGKAKSLRSRVRSYFSGEHETSVKTRHLVRLIRDVETIVVPSEAHALILENNLIKEYRPRFNIALRDDKSYPYIKVTLQEPYPRVFVTRRFQSDGARYFGPYTDVGAMRRALNVVKRIFTVRSCRYDMPAEMPERACLDWHIGRCKAPCIGLQSLDDYRAMIADVVTFLDGKPEEVTRRVRTMMEAAAASLEFERAAELRDALLKLETIEEPTVVMQVEGGDRDVVGFARDGDDACVSILRIRDGKLLARDHRYLANVEGELDDAILVAYLLQHYQHQSERAREVLLPFEPGEFDLLQASLTLSRLLVPQRGAKRELMDLAMQNARHLLEEMKLTSEESDERAIDPVYDLQRELGLAVVPRSFVCFDISHAQGRDVVASMVWFENGRPKRSEYRKFKVEGDWGNDDFASMNEVVTRYFSRRIAEDQPLPDLCVIDGGKGQLHAAMDALASIGLTSQALASLAKKEEEVFLPGRSESLRLSRRSPGLRLLQMARDEAHRFAVTFQRARRAKRTVTSQLLEIPGVGPTRRRALLKAFGSVTGVKDAGLDAIAAVPGFSRALAVRVLTGLGVEVSEPATTTSAPADADPDAVIPVAGDADVAAAGLDAPDAPVSAGAAAESTSRPTTQ
ncbi:MAG: excinuclease ABC subunit UvrC [Gemmatimonadaceae bacterium]|nr:excinuclease ABC subunit UvrC [Gemmatimonadaceae bacterium]